VRIFAGRSTLDDVKEIGIAVKVSDASGNAMPSEKGARMRRDGGFERAFGGESRGGIFDSPRTYGLRIHARCRRGVQFTVLAAERYTVRLRRLRLYGTDAGDNVA